MAGIFNAFKNDMLIPLIKPLSILVIKNFNSKLNLKIIKVSD